MGHVLLGDLRGVGQDACRLMRAQVAVCRDLLRRTRRLQRMGRRQATARISAAAALTLGLGVGETACTERQSVKLDGGGRDTRTPGNCDASGAPDWGTPADTLGAEGPTPGVCAVGPDQGWVPGLCPPPMDTGPTPGQCPVKLDTGITPGLCMPRPDGGPTPGVCAYLPDAGITPGLCAYKPDSSYVPGVCPVQADLGPTPGVCASPQNADRLK